MSILLAEVRTMSDVRSSYTDSINFFAGHTPRSLAEKFGTPLYVYSEKILRRSCRELIGLCSLPEFGVNYSVKANTNPVLLSIIREEGLSVDAMSPGEVYMDKLAGFENNKILYISNNISPEEMKNAIENKLLISVDSLSQLDMYGAFNPGGRVMIRFNPGIGAGHSKKVITAGKETKFGVCPEEATKVFELVQKHHLVLAGVNQHIGSLFMQPDDYLHAVEFLLNFIESFPEAMFKGLEIIDFGGGFGIPYHRYDTEPRLNMTTLGNGLTQRLAAWKSNTGYSGRFLVEPGRYVVAECGILLGRVEAVKDNGKRRYAGTDIGFNVLVRPVMYGSFHDFEIYAKEKAARPTLPQSIAGNICESGDLLCKDRLLPELREGDILGVLDAGAYGFVMSSTYNQRLRPAEILITEEGELKLIRRRETFADLTACLV